MKKVLIYAITVGVLATAAWSQSAEQAIAAVENQWLQAQKTNNPDLLVPLLAEKFINTSDDGKVTGRTETIASYKGTRWTSAENSAVKVVVYGDTAIAIGTYKGKGERNGKSFDVHEQWTDTWIKMPSGQWQCVASQDSPIAK
jgi:ketosteroid isomerase-like protein